ncbi:MAG: hypothetical protein AB7H80_11535 [Candidatus Kapaibacterium sp.]
MIARRLLAFTAFTLLTVATASAQQIPQGFNYQGIARDDAGAVVASQTISLRLSIINGATSTAEYVETHQVTTNGFGLFTLQVGEGTRVSGSFNGVTWAAGNKLMKVEADLGAGFVDLGASQLQSVPYALVAGSLAGPLNVAINDLSDVNAGTPTTGNVLKWNGTRWIADDDIAGFELPFADSASTTALTPLLLLHQEGDGEAIRLEGGNGLSTTNLLTLDNQGQGRTLSATLHGRKGVAGAFTIDNANNTDPVIQSVTSGVGNAGNFAINNLFSDSAAVRASTTGTGAGVHGESSGNGRAYGVYGLATGECVPDLSGLRSICPAGVYGRAIYGPGVYGYSSDIGPGVQAYSQNGYAFVGLGPTANPGFTAMRFHVTNAGKTYAEGDFYTPQSFASSRNGLATLVAPGDTGIAPGDVLVVSAAGNIVESTDTNMTTVVGVSIANAAFIAGHLLDDDGNSTRTNEIGVATSGFVTINVTIENGAIAPGDLLVSSSTRGHAMKAPAGAAQGTIIAKAVQSFTGPTEGSIKAVVMLR